MRWRRQWIVIAVLAVCVTILLLAQRRQPPPAKPRPEIPRQDWSSWHPATAQQTEPKKDDPSVHPIKHLSEAAKNSFRQARDRQSSSLATAVAEYKRRYGTHPPPRFNEWYTFARKRGSKLIDEYDNMMADLLPFWALEPRVIRQRVKQALGYELNAFIVVMIRGGTIDKLDGGPEWQLQTTRQMLEPFVHLLPDMDLAFNTHDEPRVVVPHDELHHMVLTAKTQVLPSTLKQSPRNSFSTATDIEDAMRPLRQYKVTAFNEYAHQRVWAPSRLSCPIDSPARDLKEPSTDNAHLYAMGELGFIYNQTAFSDICLTPSLRDSFGFFNRPNAFKLSHELIPVFSQSKVSSFQDILYPSPWYYYGKTVTDKPMDTHQPQYNGSADVGWSQKSPSFWWRGSTTGGFSKVSGWRFQHRQQFVQRINEKNTARVMKNTGNDTKLFWEVVEAPRQDYAKLIDIHFSGVGQCEEVDCRAQLDHFEMAEPVDPQRAWMFKYLLDIDGNAFSGRFYSFLKSKSLALKMAIFREWHSDFLWPWVHYVPLSLRGDEHLEVIRYFAEEKDGDDIAETIAKQGRDWAGVALRNEDMEVWMFRLLLEYARLVDDDRDIIGFAESS